jgi:hypothetical protein
MKVMSRTRFVLAIGLLAFGGLIAAVACDQTGTAVYRGRRYDPDKRCLEATRALDVVEAKGPPDLCLPICLVQTAYDGGIGVYVSSTCPPYPYGFDLSGKEPLCAPALRAADQVSGCLPLPPDGGPDASPDATVPEPPSDASIDASPDASMDGSDASASDAAPSDASDGSTD